MRITNQTNQTPINPVETAAPQAARTDSAPSGAQAANASSPAAPPVPVQAYLVPSFELLSLDATLQHVPPVRADILAETVRRLASGDLRTPEAINQTASAILGI